MLGLAAAKADPVIVASMFPISSLATVLFRIWLLALAITLVRHTRRARTDKAA